MPSALCSIYHLVLVPIFVILPLPFALFSLCIYLKEMEVTKEKGELSVCVCVCGDVDNDEMVARRKCGFVTPTQAFLDQ